jgi:hypothetical protein
MKVISKIPVLSYQISNSILTYFRIDKKLIWNETKVDVGNFKCDEQSFSVCANYIIIQNSEDASTIIVNLHNLSNTTLQKGCFYNQVTNSNLLLHKKNYLENCREFEVYNLKTSKIVQQFKLGEGTKQYFYHSQSIFFVNKKEEVVLFSLPTETTLWQYSVAKLGADKVSRILGVFGQVLVVVCKMPKNPIPILVGLNITDGSKLFTVQLPLYQMNNNLFFYEANNSIVSIIDEYLWEFSLSTFQVIREKYLPEVFNTEDVHIQVYLATLQGDSIYFAASEFGKSMSSAIVGIFDLKKEHLIDYIDLKPNGKFCMGGNSCPQVSGNKIYVLDTKNTLHILEREDG